MSQNPFYVELDSALRGSLVQVTDERSNVRYEGIVARLNHNKGEILLHSAERVNPDKDLERGSVWIQSPGAIEQVPGSRDDTEYRHVELDRIEPHPNHDWDGEPSEDMVLAAAHDGFTESFPLVRYIPESDTYQVLNGHKRIAAARTAGLSTHAVQVIECDDETAQNIFKAAHSEQERVEDE